MYFALNCVASPFFSSKHAKHSEVQYDNKCLQLLKKLDDLKVHLKKLTQTANLIEAVVGVGSTPVSIKEAYTLTAFVKGNTSSLICFQINDVLCCLAREFGDFIVDS